MNKTFALAAAAIVVTVASASIASACQYNTGYKAYTPAPAYTHNVVYTPSYNSYNGY